MVFMPRLRRQFCWQALPPMKGHTHDARRNLCSDLAQSGPVPLTWSIDLMQASYRQLLESLSQELKAECWQHDAIHLKHVLDMSKSHAFAHIRF